jgi:ribosomal protein S18 acetylase RimI-like enzyme
MAAPPPALKWRVEEACRNAWPALREVLLDGWLLRFSEGLTRRANSANPLRPVVQADLAGCEMLYRRLGLPTIFRVTTLVDSPVDQQLAGAGYTREGESCVLYGLLDGIEAARDKDVGLVSNPTPKWFTAMAALQNHSPQQAMTYRRVLGQIAVPAAFAALSVEGEIAALAYGAVHNGLLCFESVITGSRWRRRGYSRRVLGSLAAWARENGAEGACLETEASNSTALALYDAIGLRSELYRYHYRREPPANGGEA